MQRSVAVVGGGVGGLAAAVGLARDGWRVVVLERAPGPASDGTALGMWPDAVRALDGLGLGPGLRERSTREAGGTFRRPDGTVLATMDADRLTRGGEIRLVARPGPTRPTPPRRRPTLARSIRAPARIAESIRTPGRPQHAPLALTS